MKKMYEKPNAEIIEMEIEGAILAASGTPQRKSNFEDFVDDGEA